MSSTSHTSPAGIRGGVAAVLSEYGMLLVLAGLCAVFSVLTWSEQRPEGADGGRQVARRVRTELSGRSRLLVVAQLTRLDERFVAAVQSELEGEGGELAVIQGDPRRVRQGLEELSASGEPIDAVLTTSAVARWPLIADLAEEFPALGNPRIEVPRPYMWPTFLKGENLVNVSNQIVEIAIVAVGMTVVIIAGGIDLSVGSLIALSAMTSCVLIERVGGGREATAMAMTLASLAGIGVCGLLGTITGVTVTLFRVPPFVVTLGVMLAASGLAGLMTSGGSAHRIPPEYTWIASGTPLGIPNAIVMMLVLYVIAQFLMSRTILGRHIYAVGGNRAAAHLSGIRTHRILILTYVLSAVMAGLAGIIMASRLKSANPTYGKTYELSVIAAVVVGGTSLSGGSGKIFGTLIGALIIAVMQNGMNLLNGMKIISIDDFGQDVVLGVVLLAAVILDQWKRHGFSGWRGYAA